MVHGALDQKDEAFAWLDRAYDEQSSWTWQLRDPLWDPLRADPRFEELLRRLDLPVQ